MLTLSHLKQKHPQFFSEGYKDFFGTVHEELFQKGERIAFVYDLQMNYKSPIFWSVKIIDSCTLKITDLASMITSQEEANRIAQQYIGGE